MSNKYGYRGQGKGKSSTHVTPCAGGCGRYSIWKYCKKCKEGFNLK